MIVPRLRIVAGPNGSGKSTLLKFLRASFTFPFGSEINADEIQLEIEQCGKLDLSHWDLRPSAGKVRKFLAHHPLAKHGHPEFSIRRQTIFFPSSKQTGYLAAILSDFLRRELLGAEQSFTFETVMSGVDKIELLRLARQAGYRTYLYYVCTSNPKINRARVAGRVREGGHDVPPEKIRSRFTRSLALLPDAIRLCNRAYVFDNSGTMNVLIAEFDSGHQVSMVKSPPPWFVHAWLDKQPPEDA